MESASHRKQGIHSRKKTNKSDNKEGFLLTSIENKGRINTKPIGLSVVPSQGSSFGDAHLASNASLHLSVAWHVTRTTTYQVVQYTCGRCWY